LTAVDPVELVHQTVDEYLSDEADRIEFQLPASGRTCQWDEARVKLALKNLIENGLCHSAATDSVVVSLADHGTGFCLAVEDRGAGIAEADLAHVTEAFYRADPSRQRDTGGFGLGLYLARLVADAHGGDLRLQSRLGEGTKVILVLPETASGWVRA
jgi:signal transduction histidine kinase